jgi:phenylacetic acid degradation operon negative regulatory protein
MDDQIELVTRPTSSTQFCLFNLFAEYIVPRGGRIWTKDLLHLLELLGVGERAARSTLSRMKQRGWFMTHRIGRQSQYAITERGQAVLAEGDQRIFEEPYTNWDGRWYLVVYSLPEELRRLRSEFRKKLIWSGFGNLAPGTWVSPHDRQAELKFVTLFTADTGAGTELVGQCWDIPGLEADYRRFLSSHEPDYEAYRSGQLKLTPAACFVRRFWLTYSFQPFPRKDPNLPVELLPEDWIGFNARNIFMEYRQLLNRGMDDLMDDVVNGRSTMERSRSSKR